MKHALALALAAVIVGGALLFLQVRPAETSSGLGSDPRANHALDGIEASETDMAEPESPNVRSIAESTSETAAATVVQAAIESTGRRIEGTIVVSDELGNEHWNTSGTAVLSLVNGDHGWLRDVEIVDGRWSVEIGDQDGIEVYQLVLDGRMAVVIRRGVVEITGEPIVLRACWPGPVRIHVIDARTRLPLQALTLVLGDLHNQSSIHPGQFSERERLLEGASSPLEWKPPEIYLHDRNHAFFVISPGYAWGRVNADLRAGGERMLELEPGGDLLVQLHGDWSWTEPVLQLEAAEPSRRLIELLEIAFDGRDRLSVDGLPVGTHRVVVASTDAAPGELAAAMVEIRAGEQTFVDLDAPVPPSTELATLAGTIRIPAEYDVAGWVLHVEPIGPSMDRAYERELSVAVQMKRVPASPEEWAWSAGEVPNGRWFLRLEPLGCATEIELGAPGRDDAWLVVPPAADVSVEVVERGTLRPVELEGVRWGGLWSSEGNRVAAGPVIGRFEFRAPCGEIDLSAISNDYRGSQQGITVGPGRTHVRLEVNRSTDVTVELRDGETTVPWDELWEIHAECLEDGVTIRSSGSIDFKPLLVLDRPGPHRLHLPAIPGFEPVPPQEIVAVPGATIDHVIQLVRKQ